MRDATGSYVTPLPLRAPDAGKVTTGALTYLGTFRIYMGGWPGMADARHYQCVDCGTTYPELDRGISCNGFAITACPWHCKPGDRSARAAECRP